MNIKELAKQSGMMEVTAGFHMYVTSDTSIERFAELVAAAEREACAKIVDENLFLLVAAAAIRARDMYTKPQNIDTSAEHVHEIDKSIHEPWDTSDMAHRPNGLTIDDDDIQEYKRPWVGLTDEEIENLDLPDKPTVKQFVWFIEAKLKEKNT